MPITPYLGGTSFSPETKRVMGVAFEMVCAALRLSDRGDLANEFIARRIIELAKARRSLRVCPKTSGGITKFSEHEAD